MNKIKNILFLGYDRDETCLIELLEKRNISVMHSNLPIEDIPEYELIISFGFRHIISKRILQKIKIPVINLHISFLPWNKGAHPLFWSFYDGTPCGVSIHMLDDGIDTGEIIYQKIVDINPKILTFREAHSLLIQEIENLFLLHIDEIISLSFNSKKQLNYGSYHKASQLPSDFKGWDENINQEITRLKFKTN